MCCFVYLFIFIDPLDQARATRGRVFGSEDLLSGCIAKGRRVGTGGKVVKLMVVKPTQKVCLFVSHVENEMSSDLFFGGGGIVRSETFEKCFLISTKAGAVCLLRFQKRKDTLKVFQTLVIATLRSFLIYTICKTISAMDTRDKLVVRRRDIY